MVDAELHAIKLCASCGCDLPQVLDAQFYIERSLAGTCKEGEMLLLPTNMLATCGTSMIRNWQDQIYLVCLVC